VVKNKYYGGPDSETLPESKKRYAENWTSVNWSSENSTPLRKRKKKRGEISDFEVPSSESFGSFTFSRSAATSPREARREKESSPQNFHRRRLSAGSWEESGAARQPKSFPGKEI